MNSHFLARPEGALSPLGSAAYISEASLKKAERLKELLTPNF